MSLQGSYSGFDRDLIPRSRIRLIPVDVGEGDAAFLPSSLDAFEKAYDELARQGITTRAVVSTSTRNEL